MNQTLIEIQERGWQSLVRELGPADATRFMLCYDAGRGNYTRERKKTIKKISLEQILKEIGRPKKK